MAALIALAQVGNKTEALVFTRLAVRVRDVAQRIAEALKRRNQSNMAKAVPDPTCTHPAVQIARDVLRFCPNRGYREDMIKCWESNPAMWQETVAYWKRPFTDSKGKLHKKGHNPLAWGKLLAEFDRRWADKTTK